MRCSISSCASNHTAEPCRVRAKATYGRRWEMDLVSKWICEGRSILPPLTPEKGLPAVKCYACFVPMFIVFFDMYPRRNRMMAQVRSCAVLRTVAHGLFMHFCR